MSEQSHISIKKYCEACGYDLELQEHHIIPQFMRSENKKNILLCQTHHNIIHHFLNKVIWDNKDLSQKDLEEKIISFSDWFCKLEFVKWNPKDKRVLLSKHCIFCHNPTRFAWWDYESSMGLFGLCVDCAKLEEKKYQKLRTQNANS